MKRTVEQYRKYYVNHDIMQLSTIEREIHRTSIAIIPFISVAGSRKMNNTKDETYITYRRLKFIFLEATFYSVYRHFSKIIIFVCSDKDYSDVQSLSLPVWKLIDLKDKVPGNKMLLPKEALLYVYDKLTSHGVSDQDKEEWRDIEYIYYTESDQLLYGRGIPDLYRWIKDVNNWPTIVPHRLHVSYHLTIRFDFACMIWA